MASAGIPAADLEHILAIAAPYFRQLSGERIFITGGTGFFGRWLLEALIFANTKLNLHLDITALSRNPQGFMRSAPNLVSSDTLHWLEGDVREPICLPGKFGIIIHAATAASDHLNRTAPLEMFDTIVSGTRRVLEFADSAQPKSILFTSSGAVYGRQPEEIIHIDESYTGAPSPNDPLSAYAEGKRAAECLAAISGHPVKIARCFAFIGPHLPLNTHFAAGNFVRDAIAGHTINIRGDGSPRRSYLYAADLVIWLLAILVDGVANRPYNVGSDIEISIAELAHMVAEQQGQVSVAIHGRPTALPPERYVPSIRRAKEDLGLDIWTTLPNAVLRTIQWAQGSPTEHIQ